MQLLPCRGRQNRYYFSDRAGGPPGLNGGYFGVTSNCQGIDRFYRETRRAWQKWLCRRSNAGHVTWERMLALLERFPLPRPRIVRSYAK
jgi:hypothetical protein